MVRFALSTTLNFFIYLDLKYCFSNALRETSKPYRVCGTFDSGLSRGRLGFMARAVQRVAPYR